jgi:hypothetical protein
LDRSQDRPLIEKVEEKMKEAGGVPVYSLAAPRFVKAIGLSDHRNYWDLGIDAVMVTDTAFYRNPNYHESTDTADTLDYPRMAGVTRAVKLALLDLARE